MRLSEGLRIIEKTSESTNGACMKMMDPKEVMGPSGTLSHRNVVLEITLLLSSLSSFNNKKMCLQSCTGADLYQYAGFYTIALIPLVMDLTQKYMII